MFKLGIDIGGTFTDFVLQDQASGVITMHKSLTTADDPCIGILSGLKELTERAKIVDLEPVELFVHATTLATNSVLERRGAGVGLVTTKGFRDILQIQRQKRHELYNLFEGKPEPLVPRSLIWEVDERMGADGETIRPVEHVAVRKIAEEIKQSGCEAVAVCLLHSYVNGQHEGDVATELRAVLPDTHVTTSSDTAPVIREYERMNTVVVNAFVLPRVAAYLERLRQELSSLNYNRPYYLMHSNGGMIAAPTAEAFPVRIIESGPAAGVVAATHLLKSIDDEDAVSFDMGGTSAKVCVIKEQTPTRRPVFEIDRSKARAGSGLPIAVSSVDLIEIGSGGGSIASVTRKHLTVGPKSASSVPGPACLHTRGGILPTVTDADVSLGYIDVSAFLGGRMHLDRSLADASLDEYVAKPLGIGVAEAAWAVHSLVNAQMTAAARLMTIEQGVDPRGMAFVAFGGAGPLHGPAIARQLDCRRTIVPKSAGVSSALGLLLADVTFDVARSNPQVLARLPKAAIKSIYEGLHSELQGKTQELAGADFVLRLGADLRFAGQGHELTVYLDSVGGSEIGEDLASVFKARYKQAYGIIPAATTVEVITWRLEARASADSRSTAWRPEEEEPTARTRKAFFPDAGGWVETVACNRAQLATGDVSGPAIIEDPDCTILVAPGDLAAIDEFGNVVITHAQSNLGSE